MAKPENLYCERCSRKRRGIAIPQANYNSRKCAGCGDLTWPSFEVVLKPRDQREVEKKR